MSRLPILAAIMLFVSCSGDTVIPSTVTPAQPGPDNAPPRSLALNGTVHDTVGRPIGGATIEVVSGQNAGAVTVSDADGRYVFDPTFDQIPALRASRPGYRVYNSHAYYSTASTITGWFVLASLAPPIDLTGNRLLTLTVDPACEIPETARRRTYRTVIDSTALHRTLTLSGAKFLASEDGSGNVVDLRVSEDYLIFSFTEGRIWESLEPGSISFYGDAHGRVSDAASLSLPMWARVQFCDNLTDGLTCSGEISCESRQHRLSLSRE